jgi:hypothetical protein
VSTKVGQRHIASTQSRVILPTVRTFLFVVFGVLALPVNASSKTARSAAKIKTMACFVVDDARVYAIKGSGRFETGKFRCQAELVGSAQSDRGPVSLELRQAGKSYGKVSATTFLEPTHLFKYELEMEIPSDYNACESFELVMTLGPTTRSISIHGDCQD